MKFTVVVLAYVLVAVSAIEHPLLYLNAHDGDARLRTSKNDGRSYFYETDNAIRVEADVSSRHFGGNPPLIKDVVEGSFSWLSPETKIITVQYTADENGYLPSYFRSDAEKKSEHTPSAKKLFFSALR